MARLCVLLLVAVAGGADAIPNNPDVSAPTVIFNCDYSKPQIIGNPAGEIAPGGKTLRKLTWPWMALVGSRKNGDVVWSCNGMLINEQWIISQASCYTNKNVKDIVVRLGEYDYNDDFDGATPQDVNVTRIESHPDYSRGFRHDLALLKLDPGVYFQKFVSPVCLPWGEESNKNIEDRPAKLLTFNNLFTSDGSKKNSFQKEVKLTVFPGARCSLVYELDYREEEFLCVGDPEGLNGDCRGDAGAPLVTVEADERYVAAGFVSIGKADCRNKDFPGLYLNLRYKPYLAWIKDVAFTAF